MKREFPMLMCGWLVLATFLFAMGWQNLSTPGLYYDEAVYPGLAKEFLAGHPGAHISGSSKTEILGRPFPLLVQPYLSAMKCWLLIPIFKLFGATLAVIRGTNLVLTAAALLLCMLWIWRMLGLAEALLTGLLLVSDPAFFFTNALDWGGAPLAFICRLGGLLLALLAWRRRHTGFALAAGFVFGLGMLNKIDFGVVVAGTLLAAVYAGGRSIAPVFRTRPAIFGLALLGFLIGAAPALVSLSSILKSLYSVHSSEYPEKFHTLGAMYDGSYFYRLMDAGGRFDRMYLASPPVWTPLGIVAIIAILILVVDIALSPKENPARAARMFLLLSAVFITLGLLVLPGAIRVHHTIIVYPFPQALIAAAVMVIWRRRPKFSLQRPAGWLAGALVALAVLCNLIALQRTERLIRETGGRGWWSNALMKFAAEYQTRSDVTVESLDWGFNEQMEFLTRGPRLGEPFWASATGAKLDLPRNAHYVYLVHPPEYSLWPDGMQFMESVQHENTNAVVLPWRDEQGQMVFYSISFTRP